MRVNLKPRELVPTRPSREEFSSDTTMRLGLDIVISLVQDILYTITTSVEAVHCLATALLSTAHVPGKDKSLTPRDERDEILVGGYFL